MLPIDGVQMKERRSFLTSLFQKIHIIIRFTSPSAEMEYIMIFSMTDGGKMMDSCLY